MFFSSLTDNAKQGNELWIYGTEGSVQITIEDAVFYYEKKKPLPKEANATVIDHGVETGASYSTGNEMPYRGPGDKVQVPYEDATLVACRAFIQSVRSGKPQAVGVDIGYRAAIACSRGARRGVYRSEDGSAAAARRVTERVRRPAARDGDARRRRPCCTT